MAHFTITTAAARPFAYLSRHVALAEMAVEMPACFAELSERFARAGVQPLDAPLAHYLSYDETHTTFDAGFPVRAEDVDALAEAGLAIGETPSGEVMTGVHVGPYESLPATYEAMIARMGEEGYVPAEDMWERYASPPDVPPERTETEVIWPLVPRA